LWCGNRAGGTPTTTAELRRLLNLNLYYLYQDAADRLLTAGKNQEALAAGRRAAQYGPERSGSHMLLGFLQYINGDKDAALKEFLQAKSMDQDFKKHFDSDLEWTPALRSLLKDKDFLAKLFPEK